MKIAMFNLAHNWAFLQCSFIRRIIRLISINIYGIYSLCRSRSDSAGISNDRNKVGFGQIVPLALLILPILAAIQSYAEYCQQIELFCGSREPNLQVPTNMLATGTEPTLSNPVTSLGEDTDSTSSNPVTNLAAYANSTLPNHITRPAIRAPETLVQIPNTIPQGITAIQRDYPKLACWVTGKDITKDSYLLLAIAIQILLNLGIETFLAYSLASGTMFFPTFFLLGLVFSRMVIRYAAFASIIRNTKKRGSLPALRENELQELDNLARRILMAQAAGDIGETQDGGQEQEEE
ncbi:hypothetical protein BGZ63DRAFT_466185 [Mariannaea sp. PMI_226]|nr:hypothetical protein BGZ63DRAFT_466185 [Mariannaea sp. PMI_226]